MNGKKTRPQLRWTTGPSRGRRRATAMIAAAIVALTMFAGAPGGLLSPAPAQAAAGDPFSTAQPMAFQIAGTQLWKMTYNSNGTITYTAEGSPASIAYNSLVFNPLDGYLYGTIQSSGNKLVKIGQGGVIVDSNYVTLPADSNGTLSGTAYFSGAINQTTGMMYVAGTNVGLNSITVVNLSTKAVTSVSLSQTLTTTADLVYANGYLWTVTAAGSLYRIDPSTGLTTLVKTSALPAATGANPLYGAGYALGNGNLTWIDNVSGKAYQIDLSSPTYNYFYLGQGQANASNDAASVLGPPTDLVIGKCGPGQGTCKFPAGSNAPINSYPIGQDPASTYAAGSTFAYTLTVLNDGPGLSSGSVVTDSLPSGTTFVSSSNPTCTASGSTVQCAAGQIAAGASTSFTITVNVAAGTSGPLTNTAKVTGNEAEVDTSDNTDTHTIAIQLVCTAGAIYALDVTSPYTLLQVNSGTGTSIGVVNYAAPPTDALGLSRLNALAIAAGGSAAYSVSDYRTAAGSVSVQKYDPTTGAVSTAGAITMATGLYVIGGAIDPTTGRYWLQVYNSTNGWYEFYAFDTTTNTSLGRQFSYPWNTNLSLAGNGDLAFDATGRMYVLMSDGSTRSQIYTFGPPTPTGNLSASDATLLTSPVGAVTTQSNGIAFGADGFLYAQSMDGPGGQAVIRKIDPATGGVISSVNLTNPDGTANTISLDLASCANPSTITLQKNIVGRNASTDQFGLSITGNGVALNNTGVTSGSTTGLQSYDSAVAGAVLAVPGRSYTITETGVGGADLAQYSISYRCVDTLHADAVVASGSTASGSVTMPAASASGSNVVCTITNTPIAQSVRVDKIWTIKDPAGNTVGTYHVPTQPGDTAPALPTGFGAIATVNGTDLAWGTTKTGYTIGQQATLNERAVTVPAGCTLTSSTVTSVNGATLATPAAIPYSVGLTATPTPNTFTVTNAVTCTQTLTLVKKVAFGSAAPTSWTLTGTGPQGALPGPSGVTGTTATTANITPGKAYALAEAGGPNTYIPTSAGWQCTATTGTANIAQGAVTLAYGQSATCTITNTTAQITVLKHISGSGLSADQFQIDVVPSDGSLASHAGVAGSETQTSGNTFEVKPGATYTLSEKSVNSNLAYLALGLQMSTDGTTWTDVASANVTVPAGGHVYYRYVNQAVPATMLPLTGGIGIDAIWIAGGIILLSGLVFALLHHRRRRRLALQ